MTDNFGARTAQGDQDMETRRNNENESERETQRDPGPPLHHLSREASTLAGQCAGSTGILPVRNAMLSVFSEVCDLGYPALGLTISYNGSVIPSLVLGVFDDGQATHSSLTNGPQLESQSRTAQLEAGFQAAFAPLVRGVNAHLWRLSVSPVPDIDHRSHLPVAWHESFAERFRAEFEGKEHTVLVEFASPL